MIRVYITALLFLIRIFKIDVVIFVNTSFSYTSDCVYNGYVNHLCRVCLGTVYHVCGGPWDGQQLL